MAAFAAGGASAAPLEELGAACVVEPADKQFSGSSRVQMIGK